VEYLEKVESQFTGSSKAYVSSLIKRLISEKYTGGDVRDHILRMSNVAAWLKPLDLAIKDGFLIYLIFNLLLKEFETFEVNYNSMNDKWTLDKFIAMCVQEEERIKRNNGGVDSVNIAKHHQKRKNPPPPKKEDKGKAVSRSSDQPVDKDQYKWCKKRGPLSKKLHWVLEASEQTRWGLCNNCRWIHVFELFKIYLVDWFRCNYSCCKFFARIPYEDPSKRRKKH
jgi:molybdopterin converting factor small subunit